MIIHKLNFTCGLYWHILRKKRPREHIFQSVRVWCVEDWDGYLWMDVSVLYIVCVYFMIGIYCCEMCVEDLGILYVFVYMLYVYIVYNMYICMILSVRCMLCAEDWDGYIVFSQDRTDNPAFLNIPLIER